LLVCAQARFGLSQEGQTRMVGTSGGYKERQWWMMTSKRRDNAELGRRWTVERLPK